MSDDPSNQDEPTDPSTGESETEYAETGYAEAGYAEDSDLDVTRGEYDEEDDEPRSDWRAALHRARVPITLAMLLVLLVGAAWYGWRALLGSSEPSTSSAGSECVTPEPGEKQEVSATDVSVNVFNAGGASGLAGRTAKALTSRGFTVVQVGNDREEAHLTGVQVRGRAEDAPEVVLAAAQVSGAKIIADGREETEVDVVVGEDFENLKQGAPATLEVETETPMCQTPKPPKSPQT